MANRRILLAAPTTTYRLDDFLRAAGKIGAEVIIASNRCRTLARLWPDEHILSVPFSRPGEAVTKILHHMQELRIDAVVPADESATVLAAAVAEALQLPGNNPQSAVICRNKYRFRKAMRQHGLPSPAYRTIRLEQDPAKISPSISFPCVLKPLLLSGSRGVIRANTPGEFQDAFQRIKRLLLSREFARAATAAARHLLVEDYIDGEEVAIEGMLTQGRLRILTLFDKPDPLDGPYFEETIYVTPSALPPPKQQRLHALLERACRALGLQHGPVHAEARLNRDGDYLIEVAPRTIGGLCSRTLKFAAGVSLEELVLRHALGEETSALAREQRAAGVMMIPIPRGGVLHSVAGVEAARARPGIDDVQITIPPGNLVVPLPEGSSYLGFIFASGTTAAQVVRSLRAAQARLSFEIRPGLAVTEPEQAASG